jgi:hypothetical protein
MQHQLGNFKITIIATRPSLGRNSSCQRGAGRSWSSPSRRLARSEIFAESQRSSSAIRASGYSKGCASGGQNWGARSVAECGFHCLHSRVTRAASAGYRLLSPAAQGFQGPTAYSGGSRRLPPPRSHSIDDPPLTTRRRTSKWRQPSQMHMNSILLKSISNLCRKNCRFKGLVTLD